MGHTEREPEGSGSALVPGAETRRRFRGLVIGRYEYAEVEPSPEVAKQPLVASGSGAAGPPEATPEPGEPEPRRRGSRRSRAVWWLGGLLASAVASLIAVAVGHRLGING